MTLTDHLFALLRNALWEEKLPQETVTTPPFQALMQVAEAQTVSGLVCGALIRNNVQLSMSDAITTFSYVKRIELSNLRLQAQLSALLDLFAEYRLPLIVFKGQTLATLYPNAAERVPGDIDFYCDEKHFTQAVTVLQETWNLKLNTGESLQHIDFEYNGVLFELHFNMINFNCTAIQRTWDWLLAEDPGTVVAVGKLSVPTLSPTLNIIYTFLHLYHHLVELGVGLRQFCDMACLIHHYHAVVDRAVLGRQLDALGFTRAFSAVGWVLVHRLGLPIDEFPLLITAEDKKYERIILNIVFTGGNFGKYGRKTVVRSGLGYYIETLHLKLVHYRLFWRLSPREIRATLLHEIPKKILMAFKQKR